MLTTPCRPPRCQTFTFLEHRAERSLVQRLVTLGPPRSKGMTPSRSNMLSDMEMQRQIFPKPYATLS